MDIHDTILFYQRLRTALRQRHSTQTRKRRRQRQHQRRNNRNRRNEVRSLQQSIHEILRRADALHNSSAKVIKAVVENRLLGDAVPSVKTRLPRRGGILDHMQIDHLDVLVPGRLFVNMEIDVVGPGELRACIALVGVGEVELEVADFFGAPCETCLALFIQVAVWVPG